MRGRRFRDVLRTASIGVVVLALAVLQLVSFKSEEQLAQDDNLPPVLGRHLEKLRQAIPGNGGEPREGPDSAADQAFFQRAFPDADIPVTRIEFARHSF